MTLLPEVREELMATAARHAAVAERHAAVAERHAAVAERHAAATGRRRQHRAWRARLRLPVGLVTIGVGIACALAVALVALTAVGHRPSAGSRPAGTSSLSALKAGLAILRRPQTAADRAVISDLNKVGSQLGARMVPGLARLAAVVSTPTAGRMRVYVTVRQVRGGAYVAGAIATGPRGRMIGTPYATLQDLGGAEDTNSGLAIPGEGVDPHAGVTLTVAPDRVTRVRWTFSGARYGTVHPRPVTVYPRVEHNVAVAPVRPGEGPLERVSLYAAGGRLIATSGPGTFARHQLGLIDAVNASRTRAIAPLLRAHYSLFRTVPAEDITTDWRLPLEGEVGGYAGSIRLNFWQTRFIASLTGIDGPGMWITPGARGVCLNDPQSGSCGRLTQRQLSDGFLGGSTEGHGQETIAGLVPDGNRTVTFVLANGARVSVPVIHNVYEGTVRGHVTAVLNHDIAGRAVRHSLG